MEEDHNTPVRIIRKKVRGHGGHHGGAWKVAYADFVTAMMALFIVLWIVGQNKDVKLAIEAYFKDPGVFSTTSAGGILPGGQKSSPLPTPQDNSASDMDRLRAEAGNIAKAIAGMPDFSKFKDRIQVALTPEGLRIDLVELSEGVFFDIGNATVKPSTVQLLRIIASHISTLQNSVVIEGYTDARPYVSSGYSNWDLSTDRANSARKILEENGLRHNQVVEVRGFADRKLRTPDKPFDFSNRRVSILVTPMETAPGKTQPPTAPQNPVRPSPVPQASPERKQ